MSDATILHVCLNVADAEAAKNFYAQFGFEESWQFTTADGETTNHYVTDSQGIELQLSETTGETEFEVGTAWDHIALAVDDVDETLERIDHHGIVKEPGPQPETGAYTAFLKDPDGHVVELVHPMDD